MLPEWEQLQEGYLRTTFFLIKMTFGNFHIAHGSRLGPKTGQILPEAVLRLRRNQERLEHFKA